MTLFLGLQRHRIIVGHDFVSNDTETQLLHGITLFLELQTQL